MFDTAAAAPDGEGTPAATAAELAGLLTTLEGVDGAGVPDPARVDLLDALERVKAACAAAQARVTARFVDSQAAVAEQWHARARECSDAGDFDGWRAAREQARDAELEPADPADPGRGAGAGHRRSGRSRATARPAGIGAQVGLARRESPHRGARLVTISLALVERLPHTLAALTAGLISERRAETVVRATSHLSPDLQTAVDAQVIGAAGPTAGSWGDRQLERRVTACANRLDAAAAVERARTAERDRRVTIRPIPDTMALVTAALPVAQAVAVHAALTAAATHATATGDPRTRGQVMADTLVRRVTGQADATDVPIEVQLVITDRALLHGDDTPAHIPGYGTVPAGWARDLLTHDLHHHPDHPDHPDHADEAPPDTRNADTGPSGPGRRRDRIWLRRLFTHPTTGTLVAMDSRRRLFDTGLRRFLIIRDGTCRTPWCDAPIRHADHIHPHAHGGPTTDTNGQGLCIRCNHVKEQPGWTARVTDPGPTTGSRRPHTVQTTTPTGHTHTTTAPPLLPGLVPPPQPESAFESWLELRLAA